MDSKIEYSSKAFPGDRSFDLVSPAIFRIEAEFGGTRSFGTGFAVGILPTMQRLLLATAGHVVNQLNQLEVKWRVAQYNRQGVVTREIHFTSNPSLTQGNVPFFCAKLCDV